VTLVAWSVDPIPGVPVLRPSEVGWRPTPPAVEPSAELRCVRRGPRAHMYRYVRAYTRLRASFCRVVRCAPGMARTPIARSGARTPTGSGARTSDRSGFSAQRFRLTRVGPHSSKRCARASFWQTTGTTPSSRLFARSDWTTRATPSATSSRYRNASRTQSGTSALARIRLGGASDAPWTTSPPNASVHCERVHHALV
jgi:hypothetical protein